MAQGAHTMFGWLSEAEQLKQPRRSHGRPLARVVDVKDCSQCLLVLAHVRDGTGAVTGAYKCRCYTVCRTGTLRAAHFARCLFVSVVLFLVRLSSGNIVAEHFPSF